MKIFNDDEPQVIDCASDGLRTVSLVLEKYSNATARLYLRDEFNNVIDPGDDLVVYDDDRTPLPLVENSYYISWTREYTVKALGKNHVFNNVPMFSRGNFVKSCIKFLIPTVKCNGPIRANLEK